MAEPVVLPDPRIRYQPGYLTDPDALTDWLTEYLHWSQDRIRLFGRELLIPRLQCFIADPGIQYTYSGLTLHGAGFPAPLQQLREELCRQLGVPFNAVLANLYRDGDDAMGWHADDEPELGPDPVIASISLGATRRMRFRDRHRQRDSWGLDLHSGSLLVMGAGAQRDWHHAIPRSKRCQTPRINLTFRYIVSSQ